MTEETTHRKETVMLNWFGRRLQEVQDKKASGEAGFTLIELLVVVIIIGILAAIAIPTFLAQRDNASSNAARANVRTAGTAEQAAYTQTGKYVAVADLGDYGFEAAGATPAVTGGALAGNDKAYCIQSTGGGDTWVMKQDMGAPSSSANC